MCGGRRVRRVPRPLPRDLQVFGDPVWVCPLQWVLSPRHLLWLPHPSHPIHHPSHPYLYLNLNPPSPSSTPLKKWQFSHMHTRFLSLDFLNTIKTKQDTHKSSPALPFSLSLSFFLLSGTLHRHKHAHDHRALNLFSPSADWCTSTWRGFSHGGRLSTNTGSDKHFTHIYCKHGVSPYWWSQRCNRHHPKLTRWLTRGRASVFICCQTPLLSLWFSIKSKIGLSETLRPRGEGGGGCVECLHHLTEGNVNTNRQGAYFRAHDLQCRTFYCPHGNGWLPGCSAQKSEAGVGCTNPHSHIQKIFKKKEMKGRDEQIALFSSYSSCLSEHLHTDESTLAQPQRADMAVIIWCCVDPRSCENLPSVSPSPSHLLLRSALIPSLCAGLPVWGGMAEVCSTEQKCLALGVKSNILGCACCLVF